MPVDRDALGALGEQQVDEVLHVLEVDAGSPPRRLVSGPGTPFARSTSTPGPCSVVSPARARRSATLALQGLRGGRSLGRGGLESVDLGSESGDLLPRLGVGRLEVLDAAHQRLVPRDLVGGGQELNLGLAGDEESGGQGDRRDDEDADHRGSGHRAQFWPRRATPESSIGVR